MKIKFCKCIDNMQDYEKIVKLIEGDQHLAAVDRINQLLKKTPNAAWLLALKGEITLAMQEFDSFAETANRFNELKPDNPLSLIMKAIACSLRNEPVEAMARNILDGMSESREGLPALTLTAIKLLIQAMAVNGRMSMVGYWSDIFSSLTGDRPDDDSPSVDPTINLLAKAPTKIIEDSGKVEWKERLAEVVSLSKTFRYAQAESKLRSILRDYPDQPGPLSHLLRAQCAQLDQSGAYNTAVKLSDSLQITPEERAYFKAIALEIEPKSKSLQCGMDLQFCEIDSEDRVETALAPLDFVESPQGQSLDEVRNYYAAVVGDEVPAKRVFSIFSGSLQGSESDEETAEEREIASSVGSVILFGKQTDKPARALFISNRFGPYKGVIDQVSDLLQLGKAIEDVDIPLENVYPEFLRRPHVVAGETKSPLTMQERADQLKYDFLNMPVEALGGLTPKEAASEEKHRSALIGLLYHLEGEQSLATEGDPIQELYAELGLERPQVPVDSEADSLRLTTALDMDRVQVTDLNDRQLKGLMVRAMGLGASRVFYRCANEVRSRESFNEDSEIQVAAISGLLSMLPGLEDRLALCDQLENVLEKLNAPVGRVIIQKMTMLQAAGREAEARETLQAGVGKHPNDPYLMSFIQYAMQAQGMQPGGGAPMGSSDDLAMKMMQNAATKQQSSGGIVLPGQDSPAESADGEGSKLWLPGS
ncbi:MAG: tetratricopeptide repeat protein [Aureliella sp.]